MADFNQVIIWLSEGKKVRSKRYLEGDHFYIKDKKIMFNGPGWGEDEEAKFELEDFEANDWEVLRE